MKKVGGWVGGWVGLPTWKTEVEGLVSLFTRAAFEQDWVRSPASTQATPPATRGVAMEVPDIY